jgi:hypothetical protein
MPTASSVTAPVLRTSPSTSHLNAEVGAADRSRTDLEDSPMSPISPKARLARRTGRFPQLVDSRSGVDCRVFASISPHDSVLAHPGRYGISSNPNLLGVRDGIRNWLVTAA